jgi:hypothetical protein
MRTSSEIRSRVSAHYAFHSLRALPCGCVAAIYRTRPWDLEVVALEARGPHCFYHEHAPGALVGVEGDEPDRM